MRTVSSCLEVSSKDTGLAESLNRIRHGAGSDQPASVIRELERRLEHFCSVVCVTGQHRRLLDQLLRLFETKPEHELNIMTEDRSLFDITTLWFAGGSEGFSCVYALTELYAYSSDPSQL